MITNKNRTGKKDGLKVDARVLGQILAVQNSEFALRDTTHIAEFFAEMLITIPGIISCRVCLEEVSMQRGEMESGPCEECRAVREKNVGQKEHSLYGPDFKCGLAAQPDIQFNAIDSLYHHFGFFVFKIGDPDAFNVYKPFIGNFANYVAISFENRLQRDLLQKAHTDLEFRVEEAIRTTKLLLEQTLMQSPVPMALVSMPDAVIRYTNPACLHFLGIDDEPSLIDTPLMEIKPSWQDFDLQGRAGKLEDLPLVRSLMGFKTEGEERCIIRKDGSARYGLVSGAPIFDDTGQIIAGYLVMMDITERKQAEMTFSRERELLRTLIDNMLEEVYVKDRERRFLLVNGLVVQALGAQSMDEIIGKRDEDFMPPDVAKQFADEENEIMRTGKPLINDENTPPYKPGPNRWYLRTKLPLRDGAGNIIGLAGLGSDITERKQTEEVLKKRKDELERFERLTIGRELKMVELKNRIVELEAKLLRKE